MKKIIFVIVISLFSFSSYAAPKVTVHGILKGYNSKVVKIKTKGAIVKVPRSSLKVPVKGLMVGVATVQAQLSLDDMIKYNGNPNKKAKK